MAKIMQRWAEDDFKAMLIAQGMENAGADVFSISFRGSDTYEGASLPHSQYIVWAKVTNDEMIDVVDQEIDKQLDSLDA